MSAINEYIQSKELSNRSPHYTRHSKRTLVKFSRGRETTSFAAITHLEIEEFLSRFKNPATRRTYKAVLSSFFAFGVRRGWRPDNPCARIDNITVERSVPRILTPEQVDRILAACPVQIRPYFVLTVFVGVRPMEVTSPFRRLEWKAINLETRAVSIIGKRRHRMAPIEERAYCLLKQHENRIGPVCPSYATVSRWMRLKAAPLIGEKTWPVDVSRHSAASYLMAKYEDAGKVSNWLGNSPDILFSNYHRLVSKVDADRFWACNYPPAPVSNQLQFAI